ncbi:MAG TPA: hypothetical protein VNB49_06730, partial [Candidatus Dormibacteraeota bacterium]|nr:hypothetical protein [Candidatus Dormibacteraeota bacterium]
MAKLLTGCESEPWDLVYFKVYKSQLAVVEQALETAGLMLGTNKSRGYCLEMICADFLAGANLDGGNPEARHEIRNTPCRESLKMSPRMQGFSAHHGRPRRTEKPPASA